MRCDRSSASFSAGSQVFGNWFIHRFFSLPTVRCGAASFHSTPGALPPCLPPAASSPTTLPSWSRGGESVSDSAARSPTGPLPTARRRHPPAVRHSPERAAPGERPGACESRGALPRKPRAAGAAASESTRSAARCMAGLFAPCSALGLPLGTRGRAAVLRGDGAQEAKPDRERKPFVHLEGTARKSTRPLPRNTPLLKSDDV